MATAVAGVPEGILDKLNKFRVIRSKNAGPFVITLDAITRERGDFDRIKQVLSKASIAAAYRIADEDVISIGYYDDLQACKVCINRRRPAGEFGDADCYGMNQEEPFARLLVSLI